MAQAVPDLSSAFQDHGRPFKELLTVFFLDFVALFLPEIADDLSSEPITFLNAELLLNTPAGEMHIAVIVVRARLRSQ